jgi:hypothetical protein
MNVGPPFWSRVRSLRKHRPDCACILLRVCGEDAMHGQVDLLDELVGSLSSALTRRDLLPEVIEKCTLRPQGLHGSWDALPE